ncbi:FAD-dependent oxidoreductase [Streptomyces scabiei]|uniref:NAD(P)/FAD-dependent oxidoreductase n=1 Tax=Streptomyces scabiei TaxID=1930 RepID=UPI0004E65D21|nr:FAD-binding oxidoreductase [Streptomyces scabiei]KFF98763.1 FAD-dependent oxidoreductase [Streptomyces scabiei]
MKTIPYWIETAGVFPDRSGKPLTEDTDLVVIGAGLTGLSTALHSARKGARVILVEKGQIGSGASARNGGMANLGFTIGIHQAIRRYGLERAREIYNSYGEAVDTVQRLVNEESIDCQFSRVGRLGVASRPAHFESKKTQQRDLAKYFGHETTLIGKSELRSEIGSDAYHGGLLDPFSAALHVGRFVRGMAEACERTGVEIHERNAAIDVRRTAAGRFEVSTERGVIRAGQVMMATDAYTDKNFPWLRRQQVCLGSFIIVTEPLGEELARDIIPKARLIVDSNKVCHYFRLTPDNRLLFGGRARFAPSDPTSDKKSGQVLFREMCQIFPQLSRTKVEYVWGGSVGFAMDRIVHAGQTEDGVYYSMGYAGHGVQMATHMGQVMAEVMDGHPEVSPVRDLTPPRIPLYNGTAWFLPFAGAYYKTLDRIL